MGLGFGIKIFPGVRIRASTRGISAGFGPRAARLNVGTRGVGVSSGLGPFSAWTGTGYGRGRYSGGSRSRSGYGYTQRELAAYEAQLRRAAREEEIDAAEERERKLLSVHLERFPTAHPKTAPEPEPVDTARLAAMVEREQALPALAEQLGSVSAPPKAPPVEPVEERDIHARHKKDALCGVSLLKRRERRVAKEAAAAAALQEIAAEKARRRKERAQVQEKLDATWATYLRTKQSVSEEVERRVAAEQARRERQRSEAQSALDKSWAQLTENVPEAVIPALEEAFADNHAPAAPIDCEGDRVTVTMMMESPELVPERKPDWTPAGKRTLKKRTKTERNDFYVAALASNVLATVKETLAVAPGISEVTIIVLRRDATPGGRDALFPLYCGTFARSRIDALEWSAVIPELEILEARNVLVNRKGRTAEMVPLDLDDEPELLDVVEEIAASLGCDLGPVEGRRGGTRASTQERAARKQAQGEELVSRLLHDSDEENRSEAARRLGDTRFVGAFDALVTASAADSEWVRQESVEALGRLQDNRAVTPLIDRLRDTDSGVRETAARALGDLGDPAAVQSLIGVLDDHSEFVRWAATGALGMLKDRRAVQPLIARLEDPEPDVRAAAARVLGELGDKRAVEPLIGRLDDPGTWVRWSAVNALADLQDQRAMAPIRRAAADPDRDVREAAASAVAALTP